MKQRLLVTFFAAAAFPLLAQTTPPTNPPDQPGNPPAQQTPMPGTQTPDAVPATPASIPETTATPAQSPASAAAADTAAAPATQAPAADMRPVSGKLMTKLDSKTAKSGDDVVLQTESAVKTADGTEIPKGSKVTGHVLSVHPSSGDSSQNSQVALKFDRAELKDGKSVTIQSEIEAVAPAGGETASDSAAAMPSDSPTGSQVGNPASGVGAAGMAGANVPSNPGYPQPGAPGAVEPKAGGPKAGTIVSRNGNIAIRTTSIPGVLLANNAPGQQDPRMTQASGYLVGASKDVQLESGTKMTLNVASATPGQ